MAEALTKRACTCTITAHGKEVAARPMILEQKRRLATGKACNREGFALTESIISEHRERGLLWEKEKRHKEDRKHV